MNSSVTLLLIACAAAFVGSTHADMAAEKSSSLLVTPEASGSAPKTTTPSVRHQPSIGNLTRLTGIKLPGPARVPKCRPGLKGPCIQPRATCNATEVFECYQQFTSERLTEWLDTGLDTSNSSEAPKFEICRPSGATSPCKADLYEDCVAEVSKYHNTELAYRSQRDIFCDQEKVKEYLKEYRCLERDESHATCLREIATDNNSAGDELDTDQSFCRLALSHLECANLPSNCTSGQSSPYREAHENDARLGGCITSEPHKSSATLARTRMWLVITALYIFALGSLPEVDFPMQ